jgi:hypothetical protein
MPFSVPVTTAAGEETTSLLVRKGTVITSPISYMNRAEEFWGPNGKEFEPERWLDMDSFGRAKEIQGYKHILTFSDGPRICLGKSLALAEFKVSYLVHVLYVWCVCDEFRLASGCSLCLDPKLHVRIAPWPEYEDRKTPIYFTETKGCRRDRGKGTHESETH